MIAFAPGAYAQDTAPAADEDTSGDIIVQARRKDESLQDVPLVVNVVSQEKLNNLQIRNFQDKPWICRHRSSPTMLRHPPAR